MEALFGAELLQFVGSVVIVILAGLVLWECWRLSGRAFWFLSGLANYVLFFHKASQYIEWNKDSSSLVCPGENWGVIGEVKDSDLFGMTGVFNQVFNLIMRKHEDLSRKQVLEKIIEGNYCLKTFFGWDSKGNAMGGEHVCLYEKKIVVV